MLEIWGMKSTSSLPMLPASFWPGVVAPDRVQSMGEIEFNRVLMLNCAVRNRTIYMVLNNL